MIEIKSKSEVRRDSRFWMLPVFVAALLLRLALLPREGCTGDISCFTTWFEALQAYGMSGFYDNVAFVDYPPGLFYLYKLFALPLSALSGRIGLGPALKLIAVLFDLLTALLFFLIADRKLSRKAAMIAGTVFLFNPMTIYNSAVYGQVDAVFTFFLLVCLLCLVYERYEPAAAVFALALLLKPQAIIIGPVLLFLFLEKVRIRPGYWLLRLLGCLAIFGTLFVLLIMPFTGRLDPLWAVRFYASTMGGYHYVSLNAYNFWWMLNIHWTEDSLRLGLLSCLQWGYLLVFAAVVLCGFLYAREDPTPGRLFRVAGIFTVLFFMFCSRMHERYLYPAALFWLFAWVYTRRSDALGFGAFFSLHSFLNQFGSLNWSGKLYGLRRLVAFSGVAAAIVMVVLAFCSAPQRRRDREVDGLT